jgi:hypothetical protein
MDKLFELLKDLIVERWSSRFTLVLVVTVIGLSTLLTVSALDLGKIAPSGWVVVVLTMSLTVLIWRFTNQSPRNVKEKIGFVVAITAEDEQHAKTLRSDFVNTVRDLLRAPGLRYAFHFIEFPPRFASQVTRENAVEKLKRSKGHFMIFGEAKSRHVLGRDKHVLNLEGAVVHRSIPVQESRALGREFSEVFPRRLFVDKENDLFSFQLTSEWVNIAARYVVGLAAMISGDLDYAEELFLSVKPLLTGPVTRFPAVSKIVELLPQRLSRIYSVKVGWLMRSYTRDREHAHLEKAETVLEKARPNRTRQLQPKPAARDL